MCDSAVAIRLMSRWSDAGRLCCPSGRSGLLQGENLTSVVWDMTSAVCCATRKAVGEALYVESRSRLADFPASVSTTL